MSVCANCGYSQGPFVKNFTGRSICKNTKREQDRITKCVERRDKIDMKKYQESLHPYAV